ncbi:MAG: hypothetical protein HXY26_00585 [Hydrogenophilaceae bacterium]|nr:hypothetical protein [Hydrogenophilaceae bacterium]
MCFAALAQAAALPVGEPDVRVREDGDAYVVEVDFFVPVMPPKAWQVLTDFDHMAEFIPHLESSRVLQRRGYTWLVAQAGDLEVGIFRFRYESQREIVLLPYKSIQGHAMTGTLRLDSLTTLTPDREGTHIHYQAKGTTETPLPAMFGLSIMSERVRAQFTAMQAEILRRNGRVRG